ncbi:phosphoserine phosphatase SerB [Porphyromonas canoris]|uniref:Phosphoserine phosphatase n=1 Tax=Porphyromonas canoris TaxID=36875 RepID=A0ABR4XNF3_9PORP|nr:phosphoserine phosphatase SerB [Porphyromonas canoris]KGN93480.1 phosphoserine phosphatase [Porphyromonas canoris]
MSTNTQIILAIFSGKDRPGVTAGFTSILASHEATILDIGQADIHSHLSLGIMFLTEEHRSGDILKDLLFKANEMNIHVNFTPVKIEDYNHWVGMQGKNRYIITILAKRITADMVAKITDAIALQGMNIDNIKRLTGRIPLEEKERVPKASIEISVRGTPKDLGALQKEFMDISASLGIDVSFQQESMFRRMRRLICFDMDSTLIETEVIDELADRAGVGEEVRAITESAMRGEIDFNESFIRRVALLKGLDVSVMADIAENLPITEGVDRVMKILKKVGFKIAILSGGFTYFGQYLANKYQIDYVYANELEIKDGKLTGRHLGDIIDGKRKAELMKLIAQVEKVDIRQTVAVGDGANDLPMIATAGLGIAFHAKPKVKATAKQSISTVGLDGILYFLGYKDSIIDEAEFM